jgi:general nucleoside transport system ATP-binding protein
LLRIVLTASSVTKRYGSTLALQDVTVDFAPGEIHAVLGENGAGKSTLVGVLSGFVRPDSGTVALDGESLPLGKPTEIKHRGIEMIHQHFTLVPDFSVAENLALARLPSLTSLARLDVLAAPALEISSRLGWHIDPLARVRTLPVGVQQRIEILKALATDARVILFDEPTAVLSPDEVNDLFGLLRRLREEGKIVVLIAHKLSEVLEVADRFTVLRLGQVVGRGLRSEVDASTLAHWMVGNLPAALPARPDVDASDGLTVKDLLVRGDRGESAVRGVTLTVHRGEVLGIGGVDGNGQVELAEAVVGVRPSEGEALWEGTPLGPGVEVAYIPQDRQSDGLALTMSILENMAIQGQHDPELRRGPLLRMDRIRRWATDLIGRFSIKAPSADTLVRSLSGGNQQKVVVSRNLSRVPDLLVVANPTRGLDIRAMGFVHEKILEARQSGCAVLLFSSDLDELYALSDRVLFLSGGRLHEATLPEAMLGGEGV